MCQFFTKILFGFLMKGDDVTTLHAIGTAAVLVQVTGQMSSNWGALSCTLLVTGLCRFRVEELLQETPFPVARIQQLDKLPGQDSG